MLCKGKVLTKILRKDNKKPYSEHNFGRNNHTTLNTKSEEHAEQNEVSHIKIR